MGQLQFTCFGTFQVVLNGAPLTAFQTDKVRALLVYLAVEQQVHQRGALAQLLWPGYSTESANTSLRQTLHRLRQLLGGDEATPGGPPPWLLITRQTVQINPAAAIDMDVTTFTRLLSECAIHAHSQMVRCQPCLERLQQAVDLYDGDFLHGFTVADSDPFEEWRRITQEQFHLRTLDALIHLGNAAAVTHDEERALQVAHRQLMLEPWLEAAHRQIMRILAQRGERAAALAQYQRCRQVLAEELRLEPDAETNALYEQIRSGVFPDAATKSQQRAFAVNMEASAAAKPPPPVAPPGPPPDQTAPRPFLAGRKQELAQVEQWLTMACAGQGRLGFVVGETGSGKSALLQALVQRGEAKEPLLIHARGSCDEYVGRGLPFLPWRALLQHLTGATLEQWLQRRPAPASAASAHTTALAGGAEQQIQLTKEQLFETIVTGLREMAADRPLLLILEDLHWADDSSLQLLLYFSQLLDKLPILLLCSFRQEDLEMDPQHAPHLLRRIVSESKRHFGNVLIDLSILAQAERQQFIDGWLDQEANQLGSSFRQALLQHTEGHPLFTIELIQELRARGDLQRNAAGAWVAQPTLKWQTLPARIEGVIESHISRLPNHLRQVLRIAAIEGEAFTSEVVSRIAAVPHEQVTVWLNDDLDRRYRLIDVQHTQWLGNQQLVSYRFRHHLFQQYLYHSLNQVEQANYHAQAGQILADLYGDQRSSIALQLARHFEQAGRSGQAIEHYRLAGEKARDLTANAEAITHFRTALTLLNATPALPNPAQLELPLQLALGNALVTVDGYAAEEVGRVFQRAHRLYQQLNVLPQTDKTLLARSHGALLHGLHRFHYMRGEWPAARRVGEQLIELAQQSQEPVLQAEAHRALGMSLWHQGEFTTAHQHFEQGIAAYKANLHPDYLQLSGQDPGMICTAYTAWGLWMLGYPTQATERLERCLALAKALDHPFTLIYALQYATVFHQFCGDATATLAQAEAVITLAQQHGFTYYLGWGAILRGWAQVRLGQAAAGITELQEGLASWQATGATLARHYYLGLLADAYLMLGQQDAGLNAVAAGLAIVPASGQFWEAELYRLRGELLRLTLAVEQEEAAEAALQQAIAIAQRQGAKMLELRAVCSLSRLWQRQGKTTTARQLVQNSYSWFSEGFATLDLTNAQQRLVEISSAQASTMQAAAQPKPTAMALPPVPKHPHNLPAQLTPLIGRTQDLAELMTSLQQPMVRLLTIVGAGGMGKTRLALAVGHTAHANFADGVCFVGLAAISRPAALASAVATALGVPLQGAEPRNLLLQHLRQQHLLLILDNIEHLLGQGTAAIDLIAEILTAAPSVQILVTSRERLNLRYEQVYSVPALAFTLADTPADRPNNTPANTLADSANIAAVRLFVQAAQRSHVRFQLTEANLAAVLRICRLVQGMPLGLELAAANIEQMAPEAIADAIAQNAEFLAMDWRDMPERQRSMSAVFQWSWRLLEAQEQQVFRQLAIFQGSFTAVAAEAIAGATRPLLTRLLHKSLLQSSKTAEADGRYLIHELLRQFAAAELTAAQAAELTATRHSTYYLSLLAAQQQPIMYNAVRAAIQVIQGEIDNIRQAWRLGAGHLSAALVEQSALALREFYWLTGLTNEAIEMFTLAMQARATYLQQQHPALLVRGQNERLQSDQQAELRVYSILVGNTAAFEMVVGRHEEALALATEILQMAPVASNPVGATFGYMLQGQALRRQGKSTEALALLAESVTMARQARAINPSLLLDLEKRAHSWLASIALSNDDYATARAHAMHQLEICQQFHMQVGEVTALTCLIDVDKAQGDYARARQYAEQGLATAQQVNFLWGQAICLEHLAELAWRQGDYQQAQSLLEQTLAQFRAMNRVLEESNVTQMIGRLALWLGDAERARLWIEQAFQLLQSLGAPARESFWALSARARLHYLTDHPAAALVDAEAAWAMAREVDGGASQADALVLLGLVRERLAQNDAATTAYQEAVAIYTALGHQHHTAEPRAGLARLALAAGARQHARSEIEEVLRVLQRYPLAGFDEPFQVYLTCYTVLAANQDYRAHTLLATAHDLLNTYAGRILDPVVRHAFLENVTIHRTLRSTFAAVQANSPQAPSAHIPPAQAHAERTDAARHAIPHNLPAMLAPFIGRAREVTEISTLLQQREGRLLTIVGAGGMGKTRLALAVAQALLVSRVEMLGSAALPEADHPNAKIQNPKYPDGIFFVNLASLTTTTAVIPTIAATLGLEIQGNPEQVLQHFLQKKRLLLILDNFEHLLAGAVLVTTLLQDAPDLHILVTSRERLNLRGEQLYPLVGLDYTQENHAAASPMTAPPSAAVQLFVQSAQQLTPGFILHEAQRPALQQICHLVHGMPLALEMAAAWTLHRPVEEVAQEIAQSADFLAADWPDVPARQRSMRAIFQWSWRLLTEEEQQLLRRLALFTGSFTRTAAEAIAGATGRTLTSLVNKSLVHYAYTGDTAASTSPRHELHLLVRQFATEQLTAAHEHDQLTARYSAFYLAMLAACEAPLLGSAVRETITTIQGELNHIRQAWRWAIAHGQWDALARCAYTLSEFFAISGGAVEGEQLFQLAIAEYTRQTAAIQQAHQTTLSNLWALLAGMQFRQGKAVAAETARHAITLGVASGALEAQVLGCYIYGHSTTNSSRPTEAQSYYDNIGRLFEQVHRQKDASLFLRDFEWRYYLGLLDYATQHGQQAEAQTYGATGLRIAQALGSERGQITMRLNLITLYLEQGAFAQAEQELEFLRPATQRMHWRWGECAAHFISSFVDTFSGAYQRALDAGQTALTIVQQSGEGTLVIEITLQLAYLYALLGDSQRAWAQLPIKTPQAQENAQLHVRYSLLIIQALNYWREGQTPAAYTAATQAWMVAKAFNNRCAQGCALIYRGHIQADLQQGTAAGEDYHAAIQIFTALNAPAMCVEAQAGLAQLALQQGDIATAQQWVEGFLPLFSARPLSVTTPSFIYLVAYQVLAANQDPRAVPMLQQGYERLQQSAATLDDAMRAHFLAAIPSHRALVAAYQGLPAPDEKGTGAQERPASDAVPHTSARQPAEFTGEPPHTPAPLHDWGEMPAVDFFTGRTAEMAQLTAWLAPEGKAQPIQLISILGLGGMGKTTLAAAVTKAVTPHFRVVIWRSLLNAPPPGELLGNWLQLLARQRLTTLPTSLDEQLRLLLDYLRQERCLLVLDNVESIFGTDETPGRAGSTRPGYEGYDQLFQRIGSSDHQSCLLLTSREQPYALLRLGRQVQETGERIRVLGLTGLDQQAGQVLLQSNGLHASAQEAAKLIDNYSGNPLALQIVAATITDFFGGDVVAFRQEEGSLFDGMRAVLDQQFARLSPLEREILVWLAIEREPITVPMLRSNFVQAHPEAGTPWARTAPLLEALQALQNRSLLEKRDTGFTLQNVVIEYTTKYLVDQVYTEIYELREATPETERVIRNAKLVTSFLNRFALLKAQAKEYVRQSQVRLILQPLANQLLAQMGKAQVEARVMALVQQLQAVPVTRGYAGGNLLNLLLHLDSDLRGRDFTKIALWQVFLAGAYVPGLNLSGADLTATVFTQRFGTLSNIQFDDQGDLLLADINNQRLRLLRLRDGQLYHEIALPDWRFRQLFLSPDCKSVLMSLADHRLALVDLTTGELSLQTRHQHSLWRFCFSPDSRFAATGDSSGLICVWARQGGQLVQARQISGDAVSALAIAPDGETVASATVAGTIFLWSLADQSALRRLQSHKDEVATLSFLDNGRLLASGSHDLTVGLWDVATGELRQRLRGHTRPVRKSAAATTGQSLVTGGRDHFLYVWDWQRCAPHHLLTDHASPIDQLVISADGKQAATLDLNTVVSHWDLTQGRRIDYYAIYYNAIMSIRFSADGKALVSGGSDGAVYLWQMDKASGLRLTARLMAHKHRVFGVALHPDGNLIASAGDNAGIALWEHSSGQLLQTLQGRAKNISMLDFSPNGKWLVSGDGDGTVTLWSMPDGRQQRQLQLHTNMVTCCAFSPNRVDAQGKPRQRVASGSFDRTLAIWDAESGKLLHHLQGHTNAIGRCLFSHDGQRLISASYDETLCIWDVESGERLVTWPQLGGGYIALAVHPAGQILAVSCMDYAIRLLDLSSGRCLAELHGHSLPSISLAFHPNGQLLASSGSDETIRLWDISSAALGTEQIVCLHTLLAPTPYAGMNITGVTGISDAQKAALQALGAVGQ